MFRSIFLRRIILMMLIALIFSAVVASFLFVWASGRTLEASKEGEMMDRAVSIARDYASGTNIGIELDQQELNAIVSNKSTAGSYIIVFDASGRSIAGASAETEQDKIVLSQLQNYLAKNMLYLSGKNEDSYIIPEQDDAASIMVVQVPMISAGSIVGYIVLANPISEIHIIQKSLFQILLVSTIIVAFLMLIPVYFATRRLVTPLQKMNAVARFMGQGDFSVRANTKSRGEIGELAHSFNDLADKLSNSISELTIERNRLREIFDVISEGIVSVDLALHPVYSNPAINTLFENAKRKNFFTERLQLIPFEEVWQDFQKCIDTGTTVERTIDSRESAYLSTIVPTFDTNRQVTGATGFFSDISESEHLEQTRRDYVANVSHELRTPLTALRGLVEPLADGMVRNEDDRMRYYGIILHETLRLSRLIDDMLELSRLQARTIAFKTFPFDLNELFNELKAKFTPIMNDATISFFIELKNGPCPTVMGNPDRVEQILIILMDNAKKYTAAGGSITISTELNEKNDVVLVSVKDTGQGIHEYDIDHIFDRFYKADRARGKKGTGLGLSIAKELLNYMGETITVQSDYGEGTTFTFTLKCVHGTMWY